mmetsp:Transcript_53311/g.135261  ORF Transcript_53311/g.135261 Transcript_53311/m.135261 type:complete len:741 (+) Transcript_53311:41-2263(+)
MVVSSGTTRSRPGAVPTGISTSAPKGRAVSLMQMVGCGVLMAMVFVVVYMYRVISTMHEEQQAMRHQIQVLSSGSRPFSAHNGHSLRSGALPPMSPQSSAAPAPATRPFMGHEEPASAERPASLAQNVEEAPHAAPAHGQPDDNGFVEVPDLFYDVGGVDGTPAEKRKLGFMASVGTTALIGCYQVTDAAAVGYVVSSSTACGTSGPGNACPDCFVTSTMTQDITLTISGCSSAQWIRSLSRSGIWVYTFINPHATKTFAVTDNSGAGKTTYYIPPGSFVQAYCASSLGTSNRLYFPSYRLPTLTVDSAMTVSAGNIDFSSSPGTFATSTGALTFNGDTTISGSKTFATGTGAVTLNGNVTISGSKTFTIGSAGTAGATTIYGDVTIGAASPNTATLSLKGPFAQTTLSTFSTGTGVHSLNGDIAVAAGMDIQMVPGTGTFSTGTGAITLNGNVAVPGSSTITTGTGTHSFGGNIVVADSKSFTVGSTTAPDGKTGTSTFYGPVIIGGSSSAQTVSLKVYGAVDFLDGADGAKTFATGTGAITLNGDVGVASGMDFAMVSTGTGTFSTAAGAITLNGDVTQSGTKTFATGAGAVTLNGASTVADYKSFSVGSPGAAGATQFFGTTLMGGSSIGASSTVTVYGSVTINDDANGAAKALTVAARGTHGFYGNVYLGEGKNFEMHSPGGGTFTTATGAVSLGGDTTVLSPRTFKIAAQSAVALSCASSADHVVTSNYCSAGPR